MSTDGLRMGADEGLFVRCGERLDDRYHVAFATAKPCCSTNISAVCEGCHPWKAFFRVLFKYLFRDYQIAGL
jgi:hypothetical protein